MIMTSRCLRSLAAGVLVLGAPALALAAPQMFVYPERGQSVKQQEKDVDACSGWAVKQSGFDPTDPRMTTIPPPPPPQQVAGSGAMVRGAARGTAVGAVGGAIGDDAGTGAAIGATAGAVFGGIRRAHQIEQEQRAHQNRAVEHAAAVAQGQDDYERAFAACMAGRGYTVR